MSSEQDKLDFGSPENVERVEEYKFEPIKGYPMLNWRGKRPFTSTQFYPAQIKEIYGTAQSGLVEHAYIDTDGLPQLELEEVSNWRNKIFWGDNLQVMSHLLRDFRGKVDLIYIDPPYDSKADYKKKIKVRGKDAQSSSTSFEEKQYSDIWSNDEYLQWMYERLVVARELLADRGSIYVHIDWRKSSYVKLMLDEIFGPANFRNGIIWHYGGRMMHNVGQFNRKYDTILFYTKRDDYVFNLPKDEIDFVEYAKSRHEKIHTDEDGNRYLLAPDANMERTTRQYETDLVSQGRAIDDVWKIPPGKRLTDEDGRSYLIADDVLADIDLQPWDLVNQDLGGASDDVWEIRYIRGNAKERQGYPTQKPEELIRRVIEASCPRGGLVLDFVMGSGTTQAVAMKTGRRFIGADINLGAVEITKKRLLSVSKEISSEMKLAEGTKFTAFEVYNVNHYDIFRNPIEAKDLLLEALEVQPFEHSGTFDGEKSGRMVKIMPVNRIATKADLGELLSGFDQKLFQRRQEEKPNQPVEKILLVCMGHEPDLKAELELQAKPFRIDVEVVDILRDKSKLEFKRDAKAKLAIKAGELIIENFYPMNLLQKLSLQQEQVGEWRELVESVMVDWNYDGAVLQPAVVDVPDGDDFVSGRYAVPRDAGTIRVKITDLLSESWEGNIDG